MIRSIASQRVLIDRDAKVGKYELKNFARAERTSVHVVQSQMNDKVCLHMC